MPKVLPLIRLSAVDPFMLELKRRGFDWRPLMQEQGLPTQLPASNDLFVASSAIYALVEQSAELANDRFLGYTVGSNLDLARWDPISIAIERASTVGELLAMFTVNAGEHSTATSFFLKTESERTTFGFERVEPPPTALGQNDAFYLGFMRRLLRHAVRERWDAGQVLFRVADPECVPANDEYRIARADMRGVRISFPSQWLFERFEKSAFDASAARKSNGAIPRSLLDSLRVALCPHLQDDDLTSDKAANICGYDRRRLSRELRDRGTTLSKEIAKLRAEKASQALASTNLRVADIAQTVGFSDLSIFSRAFKNWTGQSPQEFRRNHKSANSTGEIGEGQRNA